MGLVFLLTDLLKDFVRSDAIEAIQVASINADSREIKNGDVFFALPGHEQHGDTFCEKAISNGAVAIVSDRVVVPTPSVPVIVVENVREAYAKAAAIVAGPQPNVMLAVTGTSGKTSVASFVRQMWQSLGIKGASIGTLGVDTGGKLAATEGALTTPDSLTLHKCLALLKDGGYDHVVLEASSHGLDQRRLDGIKFDVVGFTNLSHDHLDYHADMEEYKDAKLRLFRKLLKSGGAAVVNSDDPTHIPFMFAALDGGASILVVGTEGAFIEIDSVEPEGLGQRVKGRLVGEEIDYFIPLVGRFQVENALIAAAMVIQSGVDQKFIEEALGKLKGAKGRLEHVSDHHGGAVFVDYAHKPAALEKVLEALRVYTEKRLIVVFGCGGDRDKAKRQMMGEIATRLADRVFVTDDNPRTEDPALIRAEVMAAAPGAVEIAGRDTAIRAAMNEMESGDVLVIAGKGHEDYQIIGHKKHAFSDHEVVLSAVKAAS